MITLRHANERGQADFGWLQTHHSFSFGEYYDPAHMGFSALRVINDDTIQPGAGFDTHGHKDMEIITFVLKGSIAHKDSEGNVETLPAGEFQLMSAGRGIAHSEFNPSNTETLHLLQIWIQPNTLGGQPGYQQKAFAVQTGLTPIATPDGQQGTLQIKQDATLYQLTLPPQTAHTLSVAADRQVYIHQVEGALTVNDVALLAGDGAKIRDENTLTLRNTGDSTVTALVFDLP